MNMANLPLGWKSAKLGDIAEMVMGQSPPSDTYNENRIGLPFLQGKADFTESFPWPTKWCTMPLKIAPKGSVLISVRAPVGDVNLADQDYIIGRGLSSISIDNNDNGFLFYSLIHNKNRINAQGSGTTFQSINKSTLERFSILLPPLPEQRAIARALRAVQGAREARLREVALEKERKAALMEHLFICNSWNILPLEKCAFVQTGVTKGRKFENGSNIIKMPYLRVANVQDGYLDLEEIRTIEIRDSELERFLLQPGDILLTEGGDFDKLGRGFIWQGQIPQCVHQNHIFAVRVNKDLLIPEYLAYLIQSEYGKAYFLSVAHRTTHLACINSTKLKAFPTLIPDLAEQKRIVDILAACDSKIAALDHEARLHQELFRAMLEELMSGRLPAGALVEDAA
jgi:type I restriction enzyme, S subunit